MMEIIAFQKIRFIILRGYIRKRGIWNPSGKTISIEKERILIEKRDQKEGKEEKEKRK